MSARRLPDGSILATYVVIMNGAPYRRGVDTWVSATSVAAFRSTDGGASYRFLSWVAKQSDFAWSTYGPSEHDCALLPDNVTLTCVLRGDADSPCTWSKLYVNYYQTWSTDAGASWSKPVRVPGAGCVRPRLLQIEDGPLVLSGGRFCNNDTTDILLWVNAVRGAPAGSWERHSISYEHNAHWRGDARYRFDRAINSTAAFATDAYTSLVSAGPRAGGVVYQKNFNPFDLPRPTPSARVLKLNTGGP